MKKGLTKNEKRVLHGLVRYPTLNDRELSGKTGVKHSTITAIRRRLRDEGFFRTIRIPAANRLGYELMVVGYGRFIPSSSDGLINRFVNALKKENRGLYYLTMSSDFFYFISAVRNFTTFGRWKDTIAHEFADKSLFEKPGWNFVIFPFGTSMLLRHFHYSRTLSIPFELEEESDVRVVRQEVESRQLSTKERTVLSGLVLHPELTDVALSEKINASRQVISSMKRRFEKAGLMRTVRIIDLKKLGYGIHAFAHARMNPRFPLKSRREGIMKAAFDMPNFILLSANLETVICSPYFRYDDYFKTKTDILSFYSSRNYLLGDPEVELIPLSEATTPVNCDFTNLIEEALGKP